MLHTIPNVDKMDAWLITVHKTDLPEFKRIIGQDGKEYIACTPEDFENVLKVLRHGRFGWETAKDLQKIAEIQQEIIKQVLFMAKLMEEQRDLYRDRFIDSENRYLKLEHEVKINNVLHKITTFGLIGGIILIAISAL